MKKLSEALKKMLDALACAHAGEYLTQREKGQILAQNAGVIEKAPFTPEPVINESGSKARRVALYLGSELPAEVMDYVIQTCARLRHELTVVTFESENTGNALLKPYQTAVDAAGVDMKLVTLSGESIIGLKRYLRNHPEVAFLACKDSGYLGRSYLNGTQRKDALPVPVVVVATGRENLSSRPKPASDQNSSDAVVA